MFVSSMHHSAGIDETNGLPEINSFYDATKATATPRLMLFMTNVQKCLAKEDHVDGLALYFIDCWI